MKQVTSSTKFSDIRRSWHLVDLNDQIVGRVSTRIANLLMGKSKPYFVHNLDCGDYVVVINATKARVTGKKTEQKMYNHFSGYPGGLKQKPYKRVMEEDPKRIINTAVRGMLPKNKLQASMLKRFFVFENEKHPYQEKFSNK